MCGIAGLYGLDDKDTVKLMLKAQENRGPDGEGVWSDKKHKVTLGHVRLSIIDVTNLGHQPMHYLNDRFTISYNGPTYRKSILGNKNLKTFLGSIIFLIKNLTMKKKRF